LLALLLSATSMVNLCQNVFITSSTELSAFKRAKSIHLPGKLW